MWKTHRMRLKLSTSRHSEQKEREKNAKQQTKSGFCNRIMTLYAEDTSAIIAKDAQNKNKFIVKKSRFKPALFHILSTNALSDAL